MWFDWQWPSCLVLKSLCPHWLLKLPRKTWFNEAEWVSIWPCSKAHWNQLEYFCRLRWCSDQALTAGFGTAWLIQGKWFNVAGCIWERSRTSLHVHPFFFFILGVSIQNSSNSLKWRGLIFTDLIWIPFLFIQLAKLLKLNLGNL